MTKVLVIEDDSFLVDAYSTKLKKAGYQLTLATNGEEGLSQAAQVKPDIILLDLLLPKRNGFDVLGDLKASPKLKKIPVVVLSNLGQEKDIEQVRQLGATDYLIKANVTMKTIIDTIEEVTSHGGKKGKQEDFKKSEVTIKEVKHAKHHKKPASGKVKGEDDKPGHKLHQKNHKPHDKKSGFGHKGERAESGGGLDLDSALDFVEKYHDDGKKTKVKKHLKHHHHAVAKKAKPDKSSAKKAKSAQPVAELKEKTKLKDKLKKGFLKFKKH